VRSTDESQPGRSRKRGGRNQSQKNLEPRPNRAPQEQEPKQENKEPRPGRNIRGPGRNVRRNLAPANNTVDETTELVISEPLIALEMPVTEATLVTSKASVSAEEQTRQTARKNSSRRGPNRRRPRNPNYKKIEGEGDSSGGDAGEARPAQTQSYDSDFADRVERTERSEPQKSITESAPKATEE
jgi:ribonuclease E